MIGKCGAGAHTVEARRCGPVLSCARDLVERIGIKECRFDAGFVSFDGTRHRRGLAADGSKHAQRASPPEHITTTHHPVSTDTKQYQSTSFHQTDKPLYRRNRKAPGLAGPGLISVLRCQKVRRSRLPP